MHNSSVAMQVFTGYMIFFCSMLYSADEIVIDFISIKNELTFLESEIQKNLSIAQQETKKAYNCAAASFQDGFLRVAALDQYIAAFNNADKYFCLHERVKNLIIELQKIDENNLEDLLSLYLKINKLIASFEKINKKRFMEILSITTYL